jgi:hypothetical protein
MSSASTPYPYPYSQAAELDPRITIPQPVIEPALAPTIDSIPLPEKLDIDLLRSFASSTNVNTILEANPQLTHAEYTVSSTDNNTDLPTTGITYSSPPQMHCHFVSSASYRTP